MMDQATLAVKQGILSSMDPTPELRERIRQWNGELQERARRRWTLHRDLNARRETLDGRIADLMAAICAQRDDRGKPLFSNETARKAELARTLQEGNGETEAVRSAQRAIETLEWELLVFDQETQAIELDVKLTWSALHMSEARLRAFAAM